MREYRDEPKDGVWLYILIVLVVLLPGFVGGWESESEYVQEVRK